MAMALLKASMQSMTPFMAKRLARSFDDSILERILASRLLGRKTFDMSSTYLAVGNQLGADGISIHKFLGHNNVSFF